MTTAAEQLKKARAKEKRERLELALLQQIRGVKLPEPERNKAILKKDHGRAFGYGYKFDFVWERFKLTVEVQGILYEKGKRGGHQTPRGMMRDAHKCCSAVAEGWTVMLVTADLIESGFAIVCIERAIKERT